MKNICLIKVSCSKRSIGSIGRKPALFLSFKERVDEDDDAFSFSKLRHFRNNNIY